MPSRRLLASVLVALVILAGCTGSDDEGSEPNPPTDVVVLRVIDGDSVELEIDGTPVEARLISINAPELADCQGPAAREALESVLDGQTMDVESFGEDRFDRTLVSLTVSGESINRALVRSGWALALHGSEFDWTSDAQAAAESQLGMWDQPILCPLPDQPLEVVGSQANPDGPDGEVLNDEWVEIENPGPEPVDLRGWALRDESSSNRYEFAEVTIAAGEKIRVATGCGSPTEGTLFWCAPGPVWSNDGDTALLLAPSGGIVSHLFIDP